MIRGELAVVTGASSGIGLELARLLARDGYDLIIVADDAEIVSAAVTLGRAGDVSVDALRLDLAKPIDVERIIAAVDADGRVPAVLALNAGTGRAGRFVEASVETDLTVVDVNVRSAVQLAKPIVTRMAQRDRGRVLFTSSLVATMPGSHQTMYNASKSFIQSFAEGLHDEFTGTGVTVTALMPGATDTDFFRRAGMLDTVLGRMPGKDDPAKTAKQGYDAMMRGETKVVASSPLSKLTASAAAVLPDAVKAKVNRLLTQPLPSPRNRRSTP